LGIWDGEFSYLLLQSTTSFGVIFRMWMRLLLSSSFGFDGCFVMITVPGRENEWFLMSHIIYAKIYTGLP
jgi:hypothetical protein